MQQIIFLVVVGGALFMAFRQFYQIYKNIKLGQPMEKKRDAAVGMRNMLLVAFGQKKMFKRWIPAVLHLFIYAAFLITQIELIEIFIDGIFGVHRFFAPYLGGFYTFIISFIEILSVLAFVGTVAFLVRRNLMKIPRFDKPEMTGWPTLDANLILVLEILLLIGIFSMNGADILLQDLKPQQYPETGQLAISSFTGPAFFEGLSVETLVIIERMGWWLHLIVVLVFLNYLPKSKHLHILLAFPNTYLTDDTPRGQMENMPAIMNEVKSMMDPEAPIPDDMEAELPDFGANDIFQLSQKNLLEAYTCTECGRCTDVCPANITGKKLSPRKIMMDVRDRVEEVALNLRTGKLEFVAADKKETGKLIPENYDDGKTLFDYTSKEEIHACTTCNACVEACPVLINPLDIILKLRRYEVLTLSEGPQELLAMYNAVEQKGAVWAMSDAREAWRDQLN